MQFPKGTIDEQIEKHLEQNQNLFDAVVEGTLAKEKTKKFLLELLGTMEEEIQKAAKKTKSKQRRR